jgi:hypothetical protein
MPRSNKNASKKHTVMFDHYRVICFALPLSEQHFLVLADRVECDAQKAGQKKVARG